MNKNKIGVIIVLSIAMLGTTIMLWYGAIRVEAAESESASIVSWCYKTDRGDDPECYTNHEQCTDAQQSDNDAISGCSKVKFD